MHKAKPVQSGDKAAPKKRADKQAVERDEAVVDFAQRLIDEALMLRYATVQRRLAIEGPFNADKPSPQVQAVSSFKELTPRYLRKVPAGWSVTAEGFAQPISHLHAAAVAKVINAQRDELGVFLCERDATGWRMVVEF